MNSADFVNRINGLGLPVISVASASNILQKSREYTRLYLRRLAASGRLRKVERGRYCLPEVDDYTIASRMVPHSYITGYAALQHYKLTTQITDILQVISPKYHRQMQLKGHKIEFVKVKKEFIYGFVVNMNGPAYADPEKIFVDDLYLHGRQYYSEEFEFALKRGKIDEAKLQEYADRSGNKALAIKMRTLIDGIIAGKVVRKRMKA